ncbi:hypothetical protein [Salinactinospora qingdaonensis]|uniref:Luciferase-like monooxygenase n=1 Tax=Salinactinospora qingdaonensis TaxID=702744 RepID=A0ABP7FEZ7_9ACTN
MTTFRFGVNCLGVPVEEWVAYCRTTEEMGYDALFAADHLTMPAPSPRWPAPPWPPSGWGWGPMSSTTSFGTPPF